MYHFTHSTEYNASAFRRFTLLCNPYLVLELSHHPKGTNETVSAHPSLNLWKWLIFSVDLPCLSISYKWRHTICHFCVQFLSLSIDTSFPFLLSVFHCVARPHFARVITMLLTGICAYLLV
jgi:hypothetical protein